MINCFQKETNVKKQKLTIEMFLDNKTIPFLHFFKRLFTYLIHFVNNRTSSSSSEFNNNNNIVFLLLNIPDDGSQRSAAGAGCSGAG